MINNSKFIIAALCIISCNSAGREDKMIRAGFMDAFDGPFLPYHKGTDSVLQKSYFYMYVWDESKNPVSYTYVDNDSKDLFRYSYDEDPPFGNPFIYTFDYFYNDTFTLITEVANPFHLNSQFFINDMEVFPNADNLITFKFRSGAHNGKFKIRSIMRNDKNGIENTWTKEVNLKDSTYFDKEALINCGYWNNSIP